MVEAVYKAQVIAHSDATVVIEGNHYFPADSVDGLYLTRSRAKSLCLWKGVASYYSVEVDGVRARNVAWAYRHPSPFARSIKNHVAFGGPVHVVSSD